MQLQRCLILLSLFALGCSSEEVPDRPATHPVSGMVTYNGSPLADATVTYRPMEFESKGAVGRTDEQGVYQLMTYETGDGAIAGDYIVTVIKQEHTPGDPSYDDTDSPNYGKEPPPEALGKTIDLIPTKYADTDKAILTATVKEGENDIPFELAD